MGERTVLDIDIQWDPIEDDFVTDPPVKITHPTESVPDSPSEIADELGGEKKKTLTRKRARNEDDWGCNLAKKARNSGLAGISKTGHSFAARKLGDSCGEHCRFKCEQKISLADRQKIHAEFWKIGTPTHQWEYIARYVSTRRPKDRTVNFDNVSVTRKRSRAFTLDTGDKKVTTCRTMFLNTLAISENYLKTVDRKREANTGFIESDQRGIHCNKANKTPDGVFESIHLHIKQFPRAESHYCRSDSSRDYLLELGLNIKKMYRMYLQWLPDSGMNITAASESTYRRIFNTKYNIGFSNPKKDLCDRCMRHKNLSGEQQQANQESHAEHLRNRDLARTIKNLDVEEARANPTLMVACFDLEKILALPHSQIGVMYYKRKLKLFNFTIYDMATNQGYCVVWNETVGKKGSDEISSSLFEFIEKQVALGYKEFRFYSDNCGGQNRNQIIYSMYLKAAIKFKVKIVHRYLEVGHTQNSGDSMHSLIERASKYKEIFTQEGWITVMKEAAVRKPYRVREMTQDCIFDFHKFAKELKWKNIRISKVREICFKLLENEVNVTVKYDYTGESEKIFFGNEAVSMASQPLCRAHANKLPLDKEKVKDLRFLCNNGLIPQSAHNFYDELNNEC